MMTEVIDGAVAAAKEMLRLGGTEEDALLGRLARTAATLADAFCGRTVVAAAWEDTPPPVQHGMVLLTVHLWENRTGDAVPPAAVTALWRPFRAVRL